MKLSLLLSVLKYNLAVKYGVFYSARESFSLERTVFAFAVELFNIHGKAFVGVEKHYVGG